MEKKQETGRIADLLLLAGAKLAEAGIEEAQSDAELLLSFSLHKSRTEIYLGAKESIGEEQLQHFLQLIERRCRREPIAYITGEREFWSRTFLVSPAVLIPRPETEFLIEMVLAKNNLVESNGKCLDLCCGSGIIVVILALELGLTVVGSDISRPALEVCRQNCDKHGVEDRIMLVQGDLGSCFAKAAPFSLITANPPYVSGAEMAAGLQPEVFDFEPHLALNGGEEGLNEIKRIVGSLPDLLAPGGDFFMEIGAGQAARVEELLLNSAAAHSYELIEIFKDYSGRDRVVHVRRQP